MRKQLSTKKKRALIEAVCIILLCMSAIIYYDVPKRIPGQNNTITIGVFSDSYWEVQNGYSYQILDDAIRVFEKKHPNVQVEYVSGILKNDYSEWLSEQMLAANAPDVFFVLAEDFNDYAELGALKDLKPIIEEDEKFEEDAFYKSALLYGQYDKKQYAMPYECAPKLMFVNKTILDAEGILMPEDGWTWDDFYKISQAVTKDTDGNGAIDQFGCVGYTWQDAFESNGVTLFNQTGTACDFTGNKIKQSLEFVEKLDKISGDYTVTSRDFDMGRVAFYPMSFSNYRAYKSYPLSVKKYSGFEWECVPMPAGAQGDNISTLDTLLVAMNKNTKNQDAAWEMMKCLTYDSDIQAEIFDYSEGVSVLKSVTESDETLQNLINSSGGNSSMNLAALSAAVDDAVVTSHFREYDEAMSDVDEAVRAIIDGDANISMEQIIWNREINKKLKNQER